MSDVIARIIHDAQQLPPAGRAALIDALISTLDAPDAAIQQAWAAEVEDRIDAIDRGEMPVIVASDIRYTPRG
jgi:putative addiction module component (TIGR02574 family)